VSATGAYTAGTSLLASPIGVDGGSTNTTIAAGNAAKLNGFIDDMDRALRKFM
jgi:hypothetical protein